MRLDIGKLNKIREQIHKKLHQIEDQKAEVEQNKETLKNQILGLERGKSRNLLCYKKFIYKHFIGDFGNPGLYAHKQKCQMKSVKQHLNW